MHILFRWLTLMNTIMSLRVLQKSGICWLAERTRRQNKLVSLLKTFHLSEKQLYFSYFKTDPRKEETRVLYICIIWYLHISPNLSAMLSRISFVNTILTSLSKVFRTAISIQNAKLQITHVITEKNKSAHTFRSPLSCVKYEFKLFRHCFNCLLSLLNN